MAETISNQDALDMIATGHAALVANLAEPPALTPTENLATFSERGITWNLAAAAPVGKFISGDYFAVGGVVTSTVPASVQDDGTYNDAQTYTARWVHGLMVNPGSEGGPNAITLPCGKCMPLAKVWPISAFNCVLGALRSAHGSSCTNKTPVFGLTPPPSRSKPATAIAPSTPACWRTISLTSFKALIVRFRLEASGRVKDVM